MVDLAGGLVVPGTPRFSAVHADGGALIAGHDHAGRIGGVDPQRVIVVAAGRSFIGIEGAAAVFGTVERCLGDVDHVGIRGIEKHPAEVAAALNAGVVRALAPVRAAVIGAIESASLAAAPAAAKSARAGHDGEDFLSVRRNGHADAAQTSGRAVLR